MISKKKKKIQWQQYIGVLFFMMIGAICGFLMITYIESTIGDGADLSENLFTLVSLFVFMYVGFFLHIIIHEGGHLIFGKLSGYTLSSFRIGSFMWLKENDTICFRRFSLSGTGGQCLMAPPEMRDGKIPVILYNLGGSLMNVITGSIFFALHVVFSEFAYLSIVFLMFSIIGFASALMNGVPMRMGTVDNDGYNAWALNRNPDAMRAFWVQMKANERISKGVRLKDMPDEWFEMPTDDAMKNSLVATIGVFACNRLMDAHRFEEADALMTRLLCMDSGMVGLYRNLLICDQIFCELIAQKRDQRIRTKMSKDQKKFMKSMKTFPSVIRTEYAYALLWEKDLEKAEKIKERFEKCAKTYPYTSDIQSERELIEIADNIEQ